MRESTNMIPADEYLEISCGTGVNEVMNGLYVRKADALGTPVYRLVKKAAYRRPTERYLYKDVSSPCWVISEKRSQGIVHAPGCAFAEDVIVGFPADSRITWFVWDPTAKCLQPHRDEPHSNSSGPGAHLDDRDHIVVKAIAGLKISGASRALTGMHLVRCHCQNSSH